MNWRESVDRLFRTSFYTQPEATKLNRLRHPLPSFSEKTASTACVDLDQLLAGVGLGGSLLLGLLPLLAVFLFPGVVSAASPQVELQELPRVLPRGKRLTLHAKISDPKRAAREGMQLAVYLKQGKKRLLLLAQKKIGASGLLRFSIEIPKHFSTRRYYLETVLLRPIFEQRPGGLGSEKVSPGLGKRATGGGLPSARGVARANKRSSGGVEPNGKGRGGGTGLGLQAQRLWKQLRDGWGPAIDKRELSSLRSGRSQRKRRFLLPPVRSRERELVDGAGKGKKKGVARGFGGDLSVKKKSSPGQNGPVALRNPGKGPDGTLPGHRFGAGGRVKGGRNNSGSQGGTFANGLGAGRSPFVRQPRPQKDSLESARRDGTPLMIPPQPKAEKKGYNHSGAAGKSRVLSRDRLGKLDGQTDGGNVYMRQVFEPYLPHHQRITVLDRVLSGFRLRLSSKRKRILQMGGKREPDRNYFVGRVRILLIADRWTPLPSVAPDARILWARTRPRTPLIFAKDRADVMFVRAAKPVSREVFLEFGTDGDKFYFGGSLPKGVRAQDYPLSERPFVPRTVKRSVFRNLSKVGLHPRMALHELLEKLVPYLRGFAVRKLKESEQKSDLYETLISSKVGVCRHRATLFMMTMQSLGVPARFVANGAHAFAEVMFPGNRWRVVDLGGGDVPSWEGKWRGQPFEPPRDPYPRLPPKAPGAATPPPPADNPKEQPNQPYIPSGGRTDNSAGVRWLRKKKSVPEPGRQTRIQFGRSPRSKTKTRLVRRKIKISELQAAIRRLMKRRQKKLRSSYVIHSPLR